MNTCCNYIPYLGQLVRIRSFIIDRLVYQNILIGLTREGFGSMVFAFFPIPILIGAGVGFALSLRTFTITEEIVM